MLSLHIIDNGNAKSFALVNIDIKTHCGKLQVGSGEVIYDRKLPLENLRWFYGSARESVWRDARTACGALYGCLNGFNSDNAVHRRLRSDLGESNYRYLSTTQILASDGTPVTYLVAAAIVSIQGMLNTAKALSKELDERGVGSCTATITVNQASISDHDNIVYLARSTIFAGKIMLQGLGLDATKYSATIENDLTTLHYNGRATNEYEVVVLDTDTL